MTPEQIELLEKRYLRLLQFVMKMRQYQAKYFQYRASSDLKAAKRYESEVDKILKEEYQEIRSGQLNIF